MRISSISALFLAVWLVSGLSTSATAQDLKNIVLAGGCFWCVESDFDAIPGVVETVSGYSGGHVENPTYKMVGTKRTGHLEVVRITYDPQRVSLADLLTAFWHSVDPTDPGGQFCDRGEPYQTAVFVNDAMERTVAENSKVMAQTALGQEIVTPIRDAAPFYPAEDYHQDYYERNPVSYNFYRWRCGRNQRVEELWGDAAYMGIPKH